VKKFLAGIVIGFLLATVMTVSAVSPIKLIINGAKITADPAPQMFDGRVFVPARFVAEPLGATVEWDQEQNAVVITSRPTEEPAIPVDEENNNDTDAIEWLSYDELGKVYNAQISVGSAEGITLTNNGITISFPHHGNTDGVYTVTTNEGFVLLLKIENARYYHAASELAAIGFITDSEVGSVPASPISTSPTDALLRLVQDIQAAGYDLQYAEQDEGQHYSFSFWNYVQVGILSDVIPKTGNYSLSVGDDIANDVIALIKNRFPDSEVWLINIFNEDGRGVQIQRSIPKLHVGGSGGLGDYAPSWSYKGQALNRWVK